MIPFACRGIEDYDVIWHHRATIRLLVCITPDALHAQVHCILCIMYRSLIPVWSSWVSGVHSPTLLFGFLLLQVALQQPLDRASWWSFECYHTTCRTVSVHQCTGSVWFFPFTLPVIVSLQWLYNAPKQEIQLPGFLYFLLYSRKHTKRAYFGFMGVDTKYICSRCVST